MKLSPLQETALGLAIGQLIQPVHPDAAGEWQDAAVQWICQQLDGPYRQQAGDFLHGLERLDRESWAIFGYSFENLPFSQRDELLMRLQDQAVRTDWPFPPTTFVRLLAELVELAAQHLEQNAHPADQPVARPSQPADG